MIILKEPYKSCHIFYIYKKMLSDNDSRYIHICSISDVFLYYLQDKDLFTKNLNIYSGFKIWKNPY